VLKTYKITIYGQTAISGLPAGTRFLIVTNREKKMYWISIFSKFPSYFGIYVSNSASGDGLFWRPFGHPQSLLVNKCISIIL